VKRFRRNLLLAALLPLAVACGKESTSDDPTPEPVPVDPTLETVTYTVSDENFPNPERGFYVPVEVFNADRKGVNEAQLNAARLQGRTLLLLEFHLTDFVATDISEDYLETIRLKFQSIRDFGAKCVLRFCYSNGFAESDKPWDAPLDQVLAHIAQLKPLLREYADVIFVVQAGFVGSWGEWYYTENFKDGKNGEGKLLIEPCRALVDALLDAVPENRQIELRTPAIKMKLYGYTLADTLKIEEAHQPTAKARLGGHNDCYLSSSNDVGTFNGSSDRTYWQAETRFTIMGGESCDANDGILPPQCHCEGTGKYNGAIKDMTLQHFTYLNSGYWKKMITRWSDEGCLEQIKKRLGYRIVLKEGQFTKKAEAGKPFEIHLQLENVGFASLQNPRDAEFVLTDASGKVLKTWALESDPRYWMPAELTEISQTVTLPENISGTVKLHLNLPDPCETIRSNTRFSVRLANEGVWSDETGYNTLYTFTL